MGGNGYHRACCCQIEGPPCETCSVTTTLEFQETDVNFLPTFLTVTLPDEIDFQWFMDNTAIGGDPFGYWAPFNQLWRLCDEAPRTFDVVNQCQSGELDDGLEYIPFMQGGFLGDVEEFPFHAYWGRDTRTARARITAMYRLRERGDPDQAPGISVEIGQFLMHKNRIPLFPDFPSHEPYSDEFRLITFCRLSFFVYNSGDIAVMTFYSYNVSDTVIVSRTYHPGGDYWDWDGYATYAEWFHLGMNYFSFASSLSRNLSFNGFYAQIVPYWGVNDVPNCPHYSHSNALYLASPAHTILGGHQNQFCPYGAFGATQQGLDNCNALAGPDYSGSGFCTDLQASICLTGKQNIAYPIAVAPCATPTFVPAANHRKIYYRPADNTWPCADL